MMKKSEVSNISAMPTLTLNRVSPVNLILIPEGQLSGYHFEQFVFLNGIHESIKTCNLSQLTFLK